MCQLYRFVQLTKGDPFPTSSPSRNMADNKPPFTRETAIRKLKFAQAQWNSQDPERIAKGYTPECIWRNRDRFIKGTQEIIDFLTAKWEKEKNYRLRKELFCFDGSKIAVQFWYEYQGQCESRYTPRNFSRSSFLFFVVV